MSRPTTAITSPASRRRPRATGIASCRAGRVAVPDRVALPPDPALRVGDRQVGHLGPADDPADLVVLVRGRARWSAGPGRRRGTSRGPPVPTGRPAPRAAGRRRTGRTSSCQSPASRCRWSMSAGPRRVCSSTRSRSVDTRRPACHAGALTVVAVTFLQAARRVRVLAPGQRQRQRQPLQRQDVQQRRVPLVDLGDGQPGGARHVGGADHHHVGPALAEPGQHLAHRPRRPARRRPRRAPARPGRSSPAGRAAGRRRRRRAPAGTRSPSASARPPGRSGRRTPGRW